MKQPAIHMVGCFLSRCKDASVPTRSASYADPLRTMHRPAPHHAPRPSASCLDTLRTVRRPASHRVPIRSVSRSDKNRGGSVQNRSR
ncbi:MAG: hypothetical protein K2M96_02565 [Prevotella sp.]|nr:hypothetical protein [Prevotella sp.]